MASPHQPLTVCLPIDDRRRAMDFYRDAFGFEPVGPLADDGVPEPLQFSVAAGVTLMLIPRGGFGWVIDPRPAAPTGQSECLLSLTVDTVAEVDRLAERTRAAGGEVTSPPQRQDWGYVAVCADVDGHLWQIIAL